MILRNIKVLSLDATNTLIRPKRQPAEIYVQFAEKFGFSHVDREAVSNLFFKTFKELEVKKPCYDFYGDGAKSWWTDLMSTCYGREIANSSKFNALANQLFDFYRTKEAWCLTNEQNIEFLRLQRSRGLKIAIVSNFDYRLRELLHAFGITEFVDCVVTSGEVGVQKPDSAIFRLLFDHFQIFDPNLYVHIGDNYKRDYLSATGLGMNALLLAENHPDVPPSHCIKELTDLKLE